MAEAAEERLVGALSQGYGSLLNVRKRGRKDNERKKGGKDLQLPMASAISHPTLCFIELLSSVST